MNKYWTSLLCLAGLLGSAAGQAQIADGGLEVATEHARIRAERQQIEKLYDGEEAGCFQKFAVNDCRDASRARRRVEMADLRRQEISLNDAERKRKGAAQLQRMEQSAAARDQPPAAVGTLTPRGATAQTPARTQPSPDPRPPHDPAEAARAQAARKASADNKTRQQQENQATRSRRAASAAAANAPARYSQKLQEAADHKAQTAARNAASSKDKAAPLPE